MSSPSNEPSNRKVVLSRILWLAVSLPLFAVASMMAKDDGPGALSVLTSGGVAALFVVFACLPRRACVWLASWVSWIFLF
jgi:hypothetical protein